MRRSTRVIALLTAAVVSGGLVSCSSQPKPQSAIAAFLTGWQTGQFPATAKLVSPTGSALTGAAVATQIKTLSGDLADSKPTLKSEPAKVTKNDATSVINVSWPVAKGVTWSYTSTLRLQLTNDSWQAVFEPAVVQPQLKDTDKLALRTTDATRGGLLDNSGQPLVTKQPVVDIGIQPNLIKNQAALLSALDAAFKSIKGLNVDLSGLPAQIKAAKPTAWVDVVTLRDPVYQQIRSQIHDLDGTVFQTSNLELAPSSTFAHALLGTVGDVTKERMDAAPGKYRIGDQVGFGGLEQAYDDRLRGTPGISVVIPAPKAADGTDGTDQVLFHQDPVAGQTIKTTLDVKTQNAADQALASWTQPTALVAIRISDGALLAVANGPGPSGNDLALTAQVPPGSMFKTVTATNLLQAGKITPNSTVNCPETLTVGGYTIHNSESEKLGGVPLITDFAKSCNTAFASLAPRLGPTGLADTAKTLGIGIPWNLGVDAFTGKVSANGSATEQAAAAFGQGTTVVSPVVMAGAAAAVARGQWKQPHLVLDPAPADPAADQPALKPATVTALHQMMRAVVTDGTGVGDKNVPGAPMYGKTGTAEFDNNPAHTHSWFMGYRGDVAFAVFVQNGGLSTAAAVPIAGHFFTLLG